jgi:hypothetical protein
MRETAQQHKVTSPLFEHTVGRLAAVMRGVGKDQPTDSELSFGLNAFSELAPRDTAEALLCMQMVAVCEVAMAMLTGAKLATEIPTLQEKGLLATRLLGLFERQFATLQKSRQPKQIVEVRHEHRHIHARGAPPHGAPLPGAPVLTQIEGQPRGTSDPRALALAPGPALLGQEAQEDELVPGAGDAQRPMPNP